MTREEDHFRRRELLHKSPRVGVSSQGEGVRGKETLGGPGMGARAGGGRQEGGQAPQAVQGELGGGFQVSERPLVFTLAATWRKDCV